MLFKTQNEDREDLQKKWLQRVQLHSNVQDIAQGTQENGMQKQHIYEYRQFW